MRGWKAIFSPAFPILLSPLLSPFLCVVVEKILKAAKDGDNDNNNNNNDELTHTHTNIASAAPLPQREQSTWTEVQFLRPLHSAHLAAVCCFCAGPVAVDGLERFLLLLLKPPRWVGWSENERNDQSWATYLLLLLLLPLLQPPLLHSTTSTVFVVFLRGNYCLLLYGVVC